MKEKIEIPLSKNKLFLGIGGSLLFVALGIWLFLNADTFQEDSYRLFKNPMLVKGIGIASILFFGATGIFAFKKLFDKSVGLIIDSNGITDNSNASSVGLIEWKDITTIKTEQVMSTKFLLITVTNPEKYIGKAKNRMKAKLMRTNMNMYGTPLSITSNTLKYDFRKLEQIIQTEFKQNKNVD
ncbi:STM3941 family protein [Olleya aquimaris]|uniref:Uncharacterized protein n=1 Tax=Olleya aquimaris TaxID=639310 RepID=A0A327R524_9FLAO|nr:STM3941 family protein [Olleya aquimaris]RAJ11900.1 hypothetical protein LY08_02609 [Olleya aquimaris]